MVDVAGYFTDGSAASDTSGLLVAKSPYRVLSTPDKVPFGRLNGGDRAIADYSSAGLAGGAIAIVTNLTVDGTAGAGFVTAWPNDQVQPTASNVNWSGPRQTRAALAISSLASANKISYYQNVALDLLVDVSGYFTGPTT